MPSTPASPTRGTVMFRTAASALVVGGLLQAPAWLVGTKAAMFAHLLASPGLACAQALLLGVACCVLYQLHASTPRCRPWQQLCSAPVDMAAGLAGIGLGVFVLSVAVRGIFTLLTGAYGDVGSIALERVQIAIVLLGAAAVVWLLLGEERGRSQAGRREQ